MESSDVKTLTIEINKTFIEREELKADFSLHQTYLNPL